MSRSVALTALKSGINRLRVKGGADPGSLYDLQNGYVDQSGAVVSRPGTVKNYVLSSGTKGLCTVNGQLAVFAASATSVPSGVACVILRHPTSAVVTLADVHYAAPFLGNGNGTALYVVAEFSNGDIYHYWVMQADAWTASTDYAPGDLIEPTTPNGFMYRASRSAARNAWAAKKVYATGASIEPIESNGYYYTATTVTTGATSSAVEPIWPIVAAQTVKEYSLTEVASPPPPDPKLPADRSPRAMPPGVRLRYGKPGATDPLA